MRVFVAGASGAIGRQLVPRLVAGGHEVHGMTRSESKRALLSELGAVPVVADALDPDAVAAAVAEAKPDVIVHQLTSLTGVQRFTERAAEPTNRLRTEGTDNLLSAGHAVGVRRFVAQGVAGFGAYGRTGAPVKTEATTHASSRPAPGGTSRSAGRASRRRASSATSWPAGSSQPPSRGISPGSRRCSRTTSS
jgi:nucleoside-diphosphate-sugar epimerase